MKEVIVETVGKGTRTIKVGIDRNKIKRKREIKYIDGLVCSPRIFPRTGSDAVTPKSRSWKTTKKGESHAERGWQRHPGRQPSRRRNRWGRVRKHHHPSVRTLNELGMSMMKGRHA